MYVSDGPIAPHFVNACSSVNTLIAGVGPGKVWCTLKPERASKDFVLTYTVLEKQAYGLDLPSLYGATDTSFILQPVGVQVETSSGFVPHATTSCGPNMAVSVNRFDQVSMAAAVPKLQDIVALGTPNALHAWVHICELFPTLAKGAGLVSDTGDVNSFLMVSWRGAHLLGLILQTFMIQIFQLYTTGATCHE